MNSQTYTYNHVVVQEEIDALDHVNNVVYVQWIQDISAKHWNDLIVGHSDVNIVWVVVRHEIDYKGQAVLGDQVTFKTWVGQTKGVTSVRHVEIYKGTRLLARAATTWCMLDTTTLKPTRITESVLKVLEARK